MIYKTISAFFAILCVFFLNSCEENFSAETEFQQKYVMYSVFSTQSSGNPDFTIQVYISRSFDNTGLSQPDSMKDCSVKTAIVEALYKGRSYKARLKRLNRKNGKPDFYYYEITGMKQQYKDSVQLIASLEDGNVLKASCSIPLALEIEPSYEFYSGFTTNVNRFIAGEELSFSWASPGNLDVGSHLFFPSFYLYYTIDEVTFLKEIPIRYKDNNMQYPVYPSKYGTFSNYIHFSWEGIDSVVSSISAGDPNKSRYKLFKVSFGVSEYDYALSMYFSSTKGAMDMFSVRTDENVFTNIHGGIGVFGCTKQNTIDIKINSKYAQKFGYGYYY